MWTPPNPNSEPQTFMLSFSIVDVSPAHHRLSALVSTNHMAEKRRRFHKMAVASIAKQHMHWCRESAVVQLLLQQPATT
jgi:hypothetical protein